MSAMMQAVQYQWIGGDPRVVQLPVPEPGPGQVLLRVTAAGMCHSDIAVMQMTAEQLSFPLPLTLGHEAVGTVAALGPGAIGIDEGEQVAVYGPWGCGVCHKCAQGKENYCTRAAELQIRPPGIGAHGAMAEYMLIDSPRHLARLEGLDPVQAAPLTDAALTPYHAIKRSLPKLAGGSSAVVIGTGGLGHLAVQLVRATTPAKVIAMDVAEDKLALADEVGAHETVRSDEHAAARVKALTGGNGADLVLDFVGIAPTVKIAAESVAVEGDISIVGIAGAPLPNGLTLREVAVASPYWGSRAELIEVLDLARAGLIRARVETFELRRTPEIYQRFEEGRIRGRAVIVP